MTTTQSSCLAVLCACSCKSRWKKAKMQLVDQSKRLSKLVREGSLGRWLYGTNTQDGTSRPRRSLLPLHACAYSVPCSPALLRTSCFPALLSCVQRQSTEDIQASSLSVSLVSASISLPIVVSDLATSHLHKPCLLLIAVSLPRSNLP